MLRLTLFALALTGSLTATVAAAAAVVLPLPSLDPSPSSSACSYGKPLHCPGGQVIESVRVAEVGVFDSATAGCNASNNKSVPAWKPRNPACQPANVVAQVRSLVMHAPHGYVVYGLDILNISLRRV